MLGKHWLTIAALCVAATPGVSDAAVTESTFQMNTTADLVALCTAAPSDPMGTAALNFCQGFGVGVYHVLEEENAARRTGRLFCVPQGAMPSRNDAVADFVKWAKATPDAMSQRPADGVVLYLIKKYPCPRGK